MVDFHSYQQQAEASRLTGGFIPHPMAVPLEGGPFHSPMHVALAGKVPSNSSANGGGGGGGFLSPIMVEMGAVGWFSGAFLFPYLRPLVALTTLSDGWTIVAAVVAGIAAAGLYFSAQLWLLNNKYLGGFVRYGLSLLWGYLGYLWAHGDSVAGLAGWATAGAAVAYTEKRVIGALSGGGPNEFARIGVLIVGEMLQIVYFGIHYLLSAGAEPLISIALILAVCLLYKMLFEFLSHNILAYPAMLVSVLGWTGATYVLLRTYSGLDANWQLGITGLVALIAFFDKRTMVRSYRETTREKESRATARVPTLSSSDLRATLTSAPAEPALADKDSRAVVSCPSCRQSMRIPAGKSGNVQCPSCKTGTFFAT